MSRFVIVSTPGAPVAPRDRFADVRRGDQVQGERGCAWLFSADARVEDPEEALRAAVRDFFLSAEGQRVRDGEQMDTIRWCNAIPWVSDELWQRHGLTVFRHPDVTRILLDEQEDLAEDLPRPRASREAVAAMPTPLP